jgi:hypothetical protein
MAKLKLCYGAMNAGKTMEALRVIFNYEQLGHRVLLMKPAIDTKGGDTIVSRTGFSKRVDVLLEEHVEDKLDEAYFRVDKDGYYVIDHIVIPTVEWLIEAPEECFEHYDTIYVTDREKIYKVVENKLEECTIREVMERNCEGTTLRKTKLDVFYTGHLQECYINYCKKVFDSVNECAPNSRDYDTYARDFIWMTLNIIDYLISFKQYLEAQRLLEMFQTCNSFCNDKKLHGFKSKSCGCS